MDVIFMGSPEFAVPSLTKLIEKDNINVSLVVTQPDRKKGRGRKVKKNPVKITAEKNDIEVFQPENINDYNNIEYIKSINVDFIVVVAYGQILNKKILEHPKNSCINLHASILPKYRGAAPINWVIINGERETGLTTMLMGEGLDTGDILKVKKIEVDDKMNAGKLHDVLKDLGGDLLIETMVGMESNKIIPKKQNNREASYAPMLNKKTGYINWNKTAQEIHNLIRGLYPWPGAYTFYEDKKLKIIKSTYKNKNKDKYKGEIIDVSGDNIKVQTGSGVLMIKEIQMPGKRKMNVRDYLLGNKIEKNIILK